MNWYKLAEAALNITPDQFQAMVDEEKKALARNTSLSPQTQLLFFTQEYEGKSHVLRNLAENTNLSPQTQSMFFTQEYEGKDWVLRYLALNTGLSPEIQTLFFTQEYEGKSLALRWLAWNTSFLKGFTLQEMREFTKTNKLIVYLKRFKTIRAMVLL